jgi:hypothetical protein
MPLSVYYAPKACITGPQNLCLGITHLFLKRMDWAKGKQEKE